MTTPTPSKRLLLVGGGHAHIEILRRWRLSPLPDWQLCVVSRDVEPVYSGMVPGYVAGEYREAELSIDLLRLAASAGARLVHDSAVRIDPDARCVALTSGETLAYDLASLDIGSTVAGSDLPGVGEHAIASRPIGRLIQQLANETRRIADANRSAQPLRVVVVGAGAAGIELAFCLRERLLRDASAAEVCLLDTAERLLPDASRSLARRVAAAMQQRGIRWRPGGKVRAVEQEGVQLEDGEQIAADLVLWVTGAAALPLARVSGLPVDARGFVRIQPSLQVEGHPELFAVGDCASLPRMRRAGVYAVRAGPILDHNLRAAAGASALRAYRPQRDFLTLLNLGDGTAIGAKWGRSFEGRWVLRLKDRIDRGFMARYA